MIHITVTRTTKPGVITNMAQRSCKMTRMHFQLIADTIRELYDVSPLQRHEIARTFAGALCRTNSNFRRETFIAACKTEAELAVEEDERMESGTKGTSGTSGT